MGRIFRQGIADTLKFCCPLVCDCHSAGSSLLDKVRTNLSRSCALPSHTLDRRLRHHPGSWPLLQLYYRKVWDLSRKMSGFSSRFYTQSFWTHNLQHHKVASSGKIHFRPSLWEQTRWAGTFHTYCHLLQLLSTSFSRSTCRSCASRSKFRSSRENIFQPSS